MRPSRINLHARLSRNARNTLYHRSKLVRIARKFKFLAAIVVLILPIYPSFGKHHYTETSVGEYDVSSILISYDAGDSFGAQAIATSESGYIKPSGFLGDTRDISGINTLTEYTVEAGDGFSTIAEKFRVSENSILWANNFSPDRVIHPGEVIKIPPVSGVVYAVESMDTVEKIAKKFGVDTAVIQSQNNLAAETELLIGQELVIPDARPYQVRVASRSPAYTTPTAKVPSYATNIPEGLSHAGRTYRIEYTGQSRGFVWGNCTYFVAMHKNVTWRGNANQWLRNAAAQGVPTGKTPAV